MGETVPAFAIANYQALDRPTISFLHLPDHTSIARDYALAAEANDPLLHDWLGDPGQPARVIELTDPNANPYQSGAILFTPLRQAPTATLQLLLLPTQVAARFHSPHPWIQEGMERFLQCVSVDSSLRTQSGAGISGRVSRAAGEGRGGGASESGRRVESGYGSQLRG